MCSQNTLSKTYRIGLCIPTGFNCVIKPYSNEPDALKGGGGGGGRDSALSVLLHITDADRIIDLELTAPKRLRHVIFLSFFFLPSGVILSIAPLDMGSLGTLLNLLLLNCSPNLWFVPHNSHDLLSLGRAHNYKAYCFTGSLGRLRD